MRARPSTRPCPSSSQDRTGFPPVPPEDSPKADDAEDRALELPNGRKDLRQVITDRIIEMLQRGGNVFRERWTAAASRGMPRNGKTGTAYRGTNVLLLWDAAIEHGYATNVWLTYKQARALGAQVRRGQTGVMCVHFERAAGHPLKNLDADGPAGPKGTDAESEAAGHGYMMCKPFWVFNVAQIDGLPANLLAEVTPTQEWSDRSPIEGAMRFIGGCQACIRHGFDRAAYAPHTDEILMPQVERFTSAQAYCATALHELVHWTGHPSRLARQFGHRFGDSAYAFEELVAELGSAFVLGHVGLVDATIEGHAAYLDAWLRVLHGDRTAIFTASRHASEAYEYILAREMEDCSNDGAQ